MGSVAPNNLLRRATHCQRLFQGRFSPVALDEAHLIAAARYVAFNPVRAKLVAQAFRSGLPASKQIEDLTQEMRFLFWQLGVG